MTASKHAGRYGSGLTVGGLDTHYRDNYNIVRVGAPTRITETEEPPYE